MKLTAETRYQLLLEISQKVSETLDLDEILEHLLDTIQTVVDYDAAGIFILNQAFANIYEARPKQLIAGVARRGFDARPVDDDAMFTQGKGIIGHVIRSGESLVVADVRQDPRYITGRVQTRSEIAVPIVSNERTIGALNLESDRLGAFDTSDLEMLRFFANAASISIDKAMLHKQLLLNELMDQQLQMASEVQTRLLPETAPTIAGYDLAGTCLPADEIGGDYFDFIPLSEERLGISIADVSGHGIAPALVMTAYRALLRTRARSRSRPGRTVRNINRVLPEFTGHRHFVTAVFAILEPHSGQVEYVCCGQHPPIVFRADGSQEWGACQNPPLGIFPNVSYRTEKLALGRGDMLVFFTDGVVEIRDSQEADFGVEHLAQTLQANRRRGAAALIDRVIEATRQFSGQQRYLDDFTLVIVKRL